MIRDMGGKVNIDLYTDSTTGKGMATRIGLGKVRHLDTGLLWIQHHVGRQDIRLKKVDGKANLADVGSKDITVEVLTSLMDRMNFKEAKGRHAKALKVADGVVDLPSTCVDEGGDG